MRLLLEVMRDKGPEWDEVIIETLTAQVVAYLAYHRVSIISDATIVRTIYSISDRPSLLKPTSRNGPGMVDRVVSRVRTLISNPFD